MWSGNSPIDISDNEANMLQRDSIESSRLESQHEFVKALAHGYPASHHHQDLELGFIGFDISPKKLPS